MDFSEPLTRARFEDLNSDLLEKTVEVVMSTLKDAKAEKGKIEEIVLVGGSTRIPKVREMLKKEFDGKEPSEAVAYGAALQGAMLSTDQDELGFSLFDVTPLSLGVKTVGGVMSVVVPRNTVIPTKMSREYRTVHDQQTSLRVEVLQGERPLTKDCLALGSFDLRGITSAPRGVTVVKETFEVDADGILSVTAKENATNNSKSLTITSYKGNLSQGEVDRMVREAKEMAEHDKKEKARIDARNDLEKYIYDLNKAVREKLYVNGKAMVEAALREASQWLDDNENACLQDYEEKSRELKELCGLDPMFKFIGLNKSLKSFYWMKGN